MPARYSFNAPLTNPPGSASVHSGRNYKVTYIRPSRTLQARGNHIAEATSTYAQKNPTGTLGTDTTRSASKCPAICTTRNSQGTLRITFSKNPGMGTRHPRAVRHGYFHKVPSCLPTGYFSALSFIIPSCKIPADLVLFFFSKVLSIYAAGSARANREPNITSETRIESFRICIDSPIVGCVGVGSVVMMTSGGILLQSSSRSCRWSGWGLLYCKRNTNV